MEGEERDRNEEREREVESINYVKLVNQIRRINVLSSNSLSLILCHTFSFSLTLAGVYLVQYVAWVSLKVQDDSTRCYKLFGPAIYHRWPPL